MRNALRGPVSLQFRKLRSDADSGSERLFWSLKEDTLLIRLVVMAFFLGIGLSACGGPRSSIPTVGVHDGTAECTDGTDTCENDGSSSGSTNSVTGPGGGIEIDPLGPGQGDGPLSRLVIYFDFDRSEIRSDFNDMLRAHGAFLVENGSRNVRLEGHADERGSREYNIGLGQQRALAVRRVLMLQGASGDQLNLVSYGEERPVVFGSDESSYSLNRRVELVYRQGQNQ